MTTNRQTKSTRRNVVPHVDSTHLLFNFINIQIYKNIRCSQTQRVKQHGTQRNDFFVSFDFVDLPPLGRETSRNGFHEKIVRKKAIHTHTLFTKLRETRIVRGATARRGYFLYVFFVGLFVPRVPFGPERCERRRGAHVYGTFWIRIDARAHFTCKVVSPERVAGRTISVLVKTNIFAHKCDEIYAPIAV